MMTYNQKVLERIENNEKEGLFFLKVEVKQLILKTVKKFPSQ